MIVAQYHQIEQYMLYSYTGESIQLLQCGLSTGYLPTPYTAITITKPPTTAAVHLRFFLGMLNIAVV